MSQNRKPPAYQEYPASFLANKNFRLMSLEERGLLMTMRFECWENLNVPSNKIELAQYLGLEEKAIPITDRVLSFFVHYETTLICPELEDYRQHITIIRQKQSNGGKKGAAITNKAKVSHQDSCVSLDKYKLVKSNKDQDQSLENEAIKTVEKDDWLCDYDNADLNSPF